MSRIHGFIFFFTIDLLRIPPGFKSGIDFTDKGKNIIYYVLYIITSIVEFTKSILFFV